MRGERRTERATTNQQKNRGKKKKKLKQSKTDKTEKSPSEEKKRDGELGTHPAENGRNRRPGKRNRHRKRKMGKKHIRKGVLSPRHDLPRIFGQSEDRLRSARRGGANKKIKRNRRERKKKE